MWRPPRPPPRAHLAKPSRSLAPHGPGWTGPQQQWLRARWCLWASTRQQTGWTATDCRSQVRDTAALVAQKMFEFGLLLVLLAGCLLLLCTGLKFLVLIG